METFGKAVAFVAALAASIWLYAHAGSSLWGRFAVPLGLPEIGPAHAYGLVLTAKFATQSYATYEGHKLNTAAGAVNGVVYPLFVWGVGWAVHSIMTG